MNIEEIEDMLDRAAPKLQGEERFNDLNRIIKNREQNFIGSVPRVALGLVLNSVHSDIVLARNGDNARSEMTYRHLETERERGGRTLTVVIIGFGMILFDIFVSDSTGDVVGFTTRKRPIAIDAEI